MRVALYSPDRMYGFAEGEGQRVFFHVESFVYGKWQSVEQPPPPIIGEEVLVEFGEKTDPDKAPRATSVERTSPPLFLRGVVESFNVVKGWGFAKGTDGDSYFLHRSEVMEGKVPLPGQEVTFYRGYKKGRPRACYVKCGKVTDG